MAITTLDGLIDAMANNSQGFTIFKPQMHANATVAGQVYSYWTGTGMPSPGAIPGAAQVCTKDLLGGFPFVNPTGGRISYLTKLFAAVFQSGAEIQLYDRLAHMGGLNGTLTTSQAVNVDTSVATSNMALRRGAADYSEVQWWLEWYEQTGSTNTNVTVTYTNGAGTSGRTVVLSSIGTTIRLGRAIPIIGTGGEAIRSIQSIQLSANTGVAGNFGITATRAVCSAASVQTNAGMGYDFMQTSLHRIHDDACLALLFVCGATAIQQFLGSFRISQG